MTSLVITRPDTGLIASAKGQTGENLFNIFLANTALKTPGNRQERLEENRVNLSEVKQMLADSLPIEQGYRAELQAQIILLEFLVLHPDFEESYSRISPDMLSVRDADGLPKLMPFTLDKPEVVIIIDSWPGVRVSSLSKNSELEEYFFDLKKLAENGRDIVYTCEVKNFVIPSATKQKIQTAKNSGHFSLYKHKSESGILWWKKPTTTTTVGRQNIFMIAEVSDWQKQSVESDPFIVGYVAGCLWLIDHFDLTPLEKSFLRLPG